MRHNGVRMIRTELETPRQRANRARLVIVAEKEAESPLDLNRHLEEAGYSCCQVVDEDRLVLSVRRRVPDLVILNRTQAVNEGRNLIAELRQDPLTADIPIVVVIPRGGTTETLIAFALGADECLSRPFSARLFVARVTALLRRAQPVRAISDETHIGPIYVDPAACTVEVEGEPVRLTPTEFNLLWAVTSNGDRVTRRGDLLRTVFATTDPTDRRIDVHMASLRKKLGECR